MFFRSAVLALGISAVVASPVKRQETTATGVEGATGTTTELATATDTASVETSVSSAISSAIESAATGTSSAPEPTSTSETTPEEFTGCPDGYALTYAIGINTYPEIELEAAREALSDWGNAVPPPIEGVETEGEGVGATRTWQLENITATEVLVNETVNEETGSLEQQWNLTEPLQVSPSLIVANATNVLTLYANDTTNETSVQFFVNFCVNDQPAGLTLYGELVAGYLNGLNSVFSNSTEGGNSTAPAETSEPAESSEPATSSGPVGTSVQVSASSAAEAATTQASGIIDTVTGGAGGAASTAISGVTGVAGTVISGASSVLGGVIPTGRA